MALVHQQPTPHQTGPPKFSEPTLGAKRERCALHPLVAAFGSYTLAAARVNADDTPEPVLAPGLSKTKTGRLWFYVRDDQPASSTEPPAAWLDGARRALAPGE